MQVMLGIRVRLDARTRSNMLSCLVGSVTSRTRLKSLSMSSKLSYTVLHVQSGLIDGSQSTHENLGRLKSPRTRILPFLPINLSMEHLSISKLFWSSSLGL